MKSEDVMKVCQTGFGNYTRSLDDANNLLAECYGTIGRLRNDLARCRHEASYLFNDADVMRAKLNKIKKIANDSLDK